MRQDPATGSRGADRSSTQHPILLLRILDGSFPLFKSPHPLQNPSSNLELIQLLILPIISFIPPMASCSTSSLSLPYIHTHFQYHPNCNAAATAIDAAAGKQEVAAGRVTFTTTTTTPVVRASLSLLSYPNFLLPFPQNLKLLLHLLFITAAF